MEGGGGGAEAGGMVLAGANLQRWKLGVRGGEKG